MRLIDADGLLETLSNKLPQWGFKPIDMIVVETLIKNEPTISQWVPASDMIINWKLLDQENYATCKKYSPCIFRIDNQLIAAGHIASDKTIRLDEGHEIDIVMATFCKKIEFIYTAELIEK